MTRNQIINNLEQVEAFADLIKEHVTVLKKELGDGGASIGSARKGISEIEKAKDVYDFLKPSLEEFSQAQKEELCRLITGEPKPKRKYRKRRDPVMSMEEMKSRLKKTHFKSRKYVS